MPTKIEVNVQTGEQKIVELSAEELAQAQATKTAWDTEQAAKQSQPTQDEIIVALIARIAALEAR
jgi:hypothetical protein